MVKTEEILEKAEAEILKGLSFPRGRLYVEVEDVQEKKTVIPLIVEAYMLLSPQDDKKLKDRIYFLARFIVRLTKSNEEKEEFQEVIIKTGLPAKLIEQLEEIADVGRRLGRYDSKFKQDDELQGRLFSIKDKEWAVQVPNPKAGCSASVCSNCDEPVAYCDEKCPNCHYSFIGPSGIPVLEEWEKMNSEKRLNLVEKVYKNSLTDGQICHQPY